MISRLVAESKFDSCHAHHFANHCSGTPGEQASAASASAPGLAGANLSASAAACRCLRICDVALGTTALTYSPGALNFGSRPLGTASTPMKVTLTNSGSHLNLVRTSRPSGELHSGANVRKTANSLHIQPFPRREYRAAASPKSDNVGDLRVSFSASQPRPAPVVNCATVTVTPKTIRSPK